MVDGDDLESRCRGNPTAGSNPALSEFKINKEKVLENISLGTDIEKVSRFENKDKTLDEVFLKRIFTETELEYCYSNKNYAQHLCARYCAKEAVVKALADINITNIYYSDIEIIKNSNGKPSVKIIKHPELNIKISISHTNEYATATAIIYS